MFLKKKAKLFSAEQFNRLVNRIKGWEGFEECRYEDPPNQHVPDSKKTWSWGHGTRAPKNARKKGDEKGEGITISEEEAHDELVRYVKKVVLKEYAIVESKYPFTINEVRREALCDMLYNLGYSNFLKFRKFLKLLYNQVEDDWDLIAMEARKSVWWRKQCRDRAERIAKELETGEFAR